MSMSPMPSRFSAPGELMMVAESWREATWKEMREGKLALITPVTTSVEGRCVATIRWMPAARAITLLLDLLAVAGDVAHSALGQELVAPLHLLHAPAQRHRRLLRVGDDGQEQVRNAFVDGELQHLRVHHEEADFFRGGP